MASREGSEVLIDLKRVSLNDDGFYYCSLDVRPPRGTIVSSEEQQTDKSRTFTKTPAFDRKNFKFHLPDDAEDLRFNLPINVYRATSDDTDNFVLYGSQTVDVRFDSPSQMSLLDDGRARRIHKRAFLTRNLADLGVHKEQGKIEFDVTVRELDSSHEPAPSPVQSRVNVNVDSPTLALGNQERNTSFSVDTGTIPDDHEQETRASSPGLDFPDLSAIPLLHRDPSVQESRPVSQVEPSPSPTSGPLSSIRSIGGNTALHAGLAGDSLQVIPETETLVSFTGDGDEDERLTPIPIPDVTVTGSPPMESKVQQRQQHPPASPHFPASSAVSQILPHYSSLSQNQGDKLSETKDYKPLEIPPDTPKPIQKSDNEPSDLRSMAIIERLTKELEDYRLGVQKMGNDIIQMRDKIARLEQEKMFLRQDLGDQDKAAQSLVDESELDSLDRMDLVRRHVQLCQRFGAEAKRSREYSQRVQTLQNEIIKKNDHEKGLLKVQQAHTAQQALVQKLQERLERSRKYKETCRQQEEVINRLEELIAKHVRDNTLGQTTDTADVVDLLRNENSHLRASLLKFEDAKASGNEVTIGTLAPTMVKAPEVMILQQQLQEEKQRCEKLEKEMEQLKLGHGLSGGLDKWDVEQKLQRSEGRVQSLEETLTENAKSWAREKATLELHLIELKAQLASKRHSSHALTHSMPSGPYPTAVAVKKNPWFENSHDYGSSTGHQPRARQMQPVRHGSTGTMRRRSPKLWPLNPSQHSSET